MGELREARPRPRYLVAGRTHPKVQAAEGERYRNERIEQAWRLGVAGSVAFDAWKAPLRSTRKWKKASSAHVSRGGHFVSFVREKLKMPVITWTIRDKPAVDLTFKYADQMTFEGFDPDRLRAG